MDIKNQVAVITGGGSGMGEATARLLSHAGVKVALLDHRLEAATAVANEIDGFAVQCDVRDEAGAKVAIDAVIKQWGKITVCVNCAGVAPAARIVGREGAMPLNDFNDVIQVNLIGTFNMLRLCAEQMM